MTTDTTDGRPSETEAPVLVPFYLTFGTKYRADPNPEHGQEQHPHWPYATGDGWVTIMATDYIAARKVALLYFDDKFSTVYPADRFDTSDMRRYFSLGQIALIHQGTIDITTPDAPLPRWTIDKPQFHGHEPDDVVAERIEGVRGRPYLDSDTVELFHPGDCAERGRGLFTVIHHHDRHVLALELDWQNPAECATCHISIT
jgi:hypothetical protein